MKEKKERNSYVDILRGLAMLMVVLQHTMMGSSNGAENTFLFNVIWSLQMPLFVLISGYVTHYGKNISSGKELFIFIKKRCISYLLPWIVWTIVIRGMIFKNANFLNMKYLLWNMDSGYWFLFTIFTIVTIFGISNIIAVKLNKRNSHRLQVLFIGILYVCGMIILTGIGCVFGLSFLAINLTLYYMPFYFIGFLFGWCQDKIFASNKGKIFIEIVTAVSLITWITLLVRFNLYGMIDNVQGIVLRVVISLSGCATICGLLQPIFRESGNVLSDANHSKMIVGKVLQWYGIHSLEIYLIHYLILNIIKQTILPETTTAQGMGMIVLNYFITIVMARLIVQVVNQSRLCRTVMFGKIY